MVRYQSHEELILALAARALAWYEFHSIIDKLVNGGNLFCESTLFLREMVEKKDTKRILCWLRQNFASKNRHDEHGSFHTAVDELLEKINGRQQDPQALKVHSGS